MWRQDTCVVSVDDGPVVNDTVDSVVMVFAHDNVNVVGVVMMAFARVVVVVVFNDDELVMQ